MYQYHYRVKMTLVNVHFIVLLPIAFARPHMSVVPVIRNIYTTHPTIAYRVLYTPAVPGTP